MPSGGADFPGVSSASPDGSCKYAPESLGTSSVLSMIPTDILWMLVEFLAPSDIVCCFSVSRAWRDAFGNPLILLRVLKRCFPLAREARSLRQDGAFDKPRASTTDGAYIRAIFSRVACRYYHLSRGKPRSIHKFGLCEGLGPTGDREFFPVQPWACHASQIMEVDWNFPEAFWTYEDGLLVYPSAEYHQFILMDLESAVYNPIIIPFTISGKVIRRVRLRFQVLVIEWAETSAFHWLDDIDGVHRHFACAYDLTRIDPCGTENNHLGKDDESNRAWRVTLRNEWKIMFLGHPLNERDRFYSSHTKTHYAIYIWQPNRSLYTADEDAPIESLMVWDISAPSKYRPSLDPTGRIKEQLLSETAGRKGDDNAGPHVVSRFSFRELNFFLVRQRGLPGLQRLEITDDGQSIEITECILDQFTLHYDPHYDPATWNADVHTVTIPVNGVGPCWWRKTPDLFGPYRGNSSLRSSHPLTAASNGRDNGNEPWFTVISEAADRDAQVYFRFYFLPSLMPNLHRALSIRTPSTYLSANMPDFYPLLAKGKIRGNERFLVGEDYTGRLVIYRFD